MIPWSIYAVLMLPLLLLSDISMAKAEEDATKRVLRATVQIVLRDKGNNILGTGSGVFVSPHGYILTAKHVLEKYFSSPEDTRILVKRLDANLTLQAEQVAKFVTQDAYVDIALLQFPGDELPFLKVGNSSHLKINDPINAFGFEGQGVNWLSKVGRRNGLTWEVDIPLFPGSSGGPVVKEGCDVLVGIVSAGYEDPKTKALLPGRSIIVPSQYATFVLTYAVPILSPTLCADAGSKLSQAGMDKKATKSENSVTCTEVTVSEDINGTTAWSKKCL